jgi:extensin-like protein
VVRRIFFRTSLRILAISCVLASAAAGVAHAGDDADDDIGSYPLDGIERTLSPGAPLPCAGPGLVTYKGEGLRYSAPARVDPAFRERLRVLDRIVVQTATELYGRAPLRMQHLGTMNCRRMRLYGDWVSEHALGNAIDVAGFDFGPLPRGASLPEGAPKALRGAFSVSVLQHWNTTRGAGAVHREFLRRLAQRLIDRTDVFRVVLGPAWPGHRNHLHLDCAPYRVVAVF